MNIYTTQIQSAATKQKNYSTQSQAVKTNPNYNQLTIFNLHI